MFKNFDTKKLLLRFLLKAAGISVILAFVVFSPLKALASNADSNGPGQNEPHEILPIALSGTASDQAVTLAWVDQNNPDELVGYQIIYGTSASLSFAPPSYQASLEVEIQSQALIGNLNNLTQYYFRIARVTPQGFSGESNTIVLEPRDTIAPVTSLATDPSIPQGLANYFTVAPSILLQVDESATIYYQWNSLIEANWQIYTGAIVAPEGENVLYYYSVDTSANVESVKWQLFKVDTVAPLIPTLDAIYGQTSGSIQLSWSADLGAAYFEVWQITPERILLGKVTADQLSYLLESVSASTNYQFLVIVYDQAGNFSKSSLSSVQTPAPVVQIVSAPVATSQPSEPSAKVAPQIGEGVSSIAQAPNTSETPKAIEGAADSNTQTENSLNKLLTALSILIIAAGIAIGGYYGYEWMSSKKPKDDQDNSSRW